MKQSLVLSDILDEFEINRLGKLMFRTVVNSFFLEGQADGRTDRQTDTNFTLTYRNRNATKFEHFLQYHNSIVHIKL